MTGARVFQTRELNGNPVRSHSKLIAVDQQFLNVTRADFSLMAEHHNAKLGRSPRRLLS